METCWHFRNRKKTIFLLDTCTQNISFISCLGNSSFDFYWLFWWSGRVLDRSIKQLTKAKSYLLDMSTWSLPRGWCSAGSKCRGSGTRQYLWNTKRKQHSHFPEKYRNIRQLSNGVGGQEHNYSFLAVPIFFVSFRIILGPPMMCNGTYVYVPTTVGFAIFFCSIKTPPVLCWGRN